MTEKMLTPVAGSFDGTVRTRDTVLSTMILAGTRDPGLGVRDPGLEIRDSASGLGYSLVVVAVLILAGQISAGPCPAEAVGLLQEAGARLAALDEVGALDRLRRQPLLGCEDAEVAEIYLGGLEASMEAYRVGGSASSLVPVRDAVAKLASLARGQPGPAEIARLVLLAAGAAAQSERDEMNAFLTHALEMEALQRAAWQPGAPLLRALEVAGDLWLRVHRYDDARRAYLRAAEELGRSPRIMAGVARAAARLKDSATACSEFRALLAWWGPRTEERPEIAEARAYLQGPECGGQ